MPYLSFPLKDNFSETPRGTSSFRFGDLLVPPQGTERVQSVLLSVPHELLATSFLRNGTRFLQNNTALLTLIMRCVDCAWREIVSGWS